MASIWQIYEIEHMAAAAATAAAALFNISLYKIVI